MMRTCLTEEPGGPWSAEALGRLIEALARSDHRDEAVVQARAYLRLYPDGSYATFAAALSK